jgi:hypothetical protein
MRVEELQRRLSDLAHDVQVDTKGALRRVTQRHRARRQRMRLCAMAGAFVLLIAVFAVSRRSDDPDNRVIAGPSTTFVVRPSVDGRMIPATDRDGTTLLLPITLPDGRRYELRYPDTVDLAALGVRMFVKVDWPLRAAGNGPLPCCSREFALTYTTVAQLYPDAAPVSTYTGADGTSVSLFHAAQRVTPPGPYPTADYLVFQFGPWVAEVWDSVPASFASVEPLNEEQRGVWASNLRASVAPDGFLVLHPEAPLHLGDPKMVQISIGDAHRISPYVDLWQFVCGQPESDTQVRRSLPSTAGAEAGVAWCDPVTGFHVTAAGPNEFTRPISDAFEIRELPPR